MVVKKRKNRCSGTGGLEFESPHFDQKTEEVAPGVTSSVFFLGVGEEKYIHAQHEGVRILREDASSLLVNSERENVAVRQYLHTSTKRKVPKSLDFTGISALFLFNSKRVKLLQNCI